MKTKNVVREESHFYAQRLPCFPLVNNQPQLSIVLHYSYRLPFLRRMASFRLVLSWLALPARLTLATPLLPPSQEGRSCPNARILNQ